LELISRDLFPENQLKGGQESQRLRNRANAPLHTKRKRIRARCLDPAFPNVRNVTIRVGDLVSVRRGDWGNPGHDKDEGGKRLGSSRGKEGVEANVIAVDIKTGRVFVEGVSHSTSESKAEGIPLHASNVVVIKIDDGDVVRLKKLEERNGGDE
jgi:large subunit ribosomal protein L24